MSEGFGGEIYEGHEDEGDREVRWESDCDDGKIRKVGK